MADSTTSQIDFPKIASLQPIWERIFHHSPIAPDNDFFTLGGNARLAAELLTELNNDFGTHLPPAAICTSPTIATLARTIDHPPSQGPAVLLKGSTTQAVPIFMFHGIGSSVVDLVPLVRRMKSDHPIYGLESRGNDGREQPQERIDDIAQSFLAAMRVIQPHGPYFLVGYSFGGLVALELAQRLKAESEKIGLLVMLDSYPDRHYLSYPQYWRLLAQLVWNRLSGRTKLKAASGTRPRPPGDQRKSLVDALQRVKAAHYRALRNYPPHFYDGEVKFVRAAIPSDFPPDPVPVWSNVFRRLDVETVPGKHVTMLTVSADPLASLLDKYLRDANADQRARTP
jgi:acetoacetyl-CoA synthetase